MATRFALAVMLVVAGCADQGGAASAGGAGLTQGDPPSLSPPDLQAGVPIGPYLNGTLPDVVPTPGDIRLVDAFPSLSWVDPIDFRAQPGSNRLWIAEVAGRIWSVDNDRTASQRDLVLDLRSRVFQNERGGLLGFAFHPDWGSTGPDHDYVYVYYQWAPALVQVDDKQPWSWAHYRRLSRFARAAGQTALDPSSEQVLIQQYAPSLLHAGGGVFFGSDGFLYLSVGDAGTFWDYALHTQRIDKTLASGVVRIDVDRKPARSHAIRRQPVDVLPLPGGWPPSSSANYFVPDSNPWLDVGGGALEEFWALGLRSPHRISQDRANGDVWVGDVGQNTREEISLVRKGDNLQWPFMEGTFPLHARPPIVIGREVGPVWDYPRTVGNCIVAGHVYHGSQLPELRNQLVSVDNVRGTVFATTRSGFTQSVSSVPANTGEFNGAACVGVDQQGELYVCRWNGPRQSGAKVFAVVRRGVATRQPPPLLSGVRAFTDLQSLRPVPGLRAYEINAPFWSDGAVKTRFVAVPNDGVHDSPGERIGFNEEREWSFPAGTVVVKHFELPLDLTRQDGPTRRLETRFLVKTAVSWYGITYRWRPDGTEADLLADATSDQISVLTQSGPEMRTWEYPSRGQCLQCHNGNAGFALGLTTRQLNRPMRHPTNGSACNQLHVWNELGIFDPPIREARLQQLPRLAAVDDASASLEHRVRSYFDSNCSQCHRPHGIFGALFDARLSTPPAEQGIVGGALYDPRGIPGAKVIELGQPVKSLAFLRTASVDPDLRMPSIGKNHADYTGLAVLGAWIQSAQGIADFAAAAHVGPPGLLVGFQDTSTVAGAAWLWDFGDGGMSAQRNPTHVYGRPGRYDVTLTVTASGGPYSARRAGWVVIGTNVATAGTARQSSTLDGHVASRAIDGNTDGDVNNGSVSETDFETNPWWEIDIRSVQSLSTVRLWNRTTLGKEWLSQFRVFLSDVPFVSGDIDQVTAQPGVTTIRIGPMVEGSLLLDVDRTARYLRVQSELATVMSLAEVEAFGAPRASFRLR